MKPATFFISTTKFIFTKLLNVSERLKIKRFWNIFKTENTITLSKTILERPYEDLQGSWKGAIFKGPIQMSKEHT